MRMPPRFVLGGIFYGILDPTTIGSYPERYMFKTFATAVARRFATLSKQELYTVDVTDLFASYLDLDPTKRHGRRRR